MATTSQLRSWWSDYRCVISRYTYVAFPGPDREWRQPVATPSADLWRRFADVMREHNYLFREVGGGTYNCRKIAGSTSYSLHAYAIALDLNPSKNPYGTRTTDMPKAFRDDIKAIRTTRGSQAFTWGGDWATGPDPMHWQLNVSPSDTELEDTMALTANEEKFVKDLFTRMRELYPNDTVPSAAGLSTYLIPDVRKNIVTMDELQAIVSTSGTIDEVARKLANANAAKLARIKEAI